MQTKKCQKRDIVFLFTSFVSSALIETHEEKAFLSWMRENNYAYIGEEYAFRLGIYLSNMRYIKEHNKAGSSYKLEGNRFAAFTPAEYRSMLSKPKSLAKKFESAPLKH